MQSDWKKYLKRNVGRMVYGDVRQICHMALLKTTKWSFLSIEIFIFENIISVL